MTSFGENIENLAHFVRIRIHQVEAVTVLAFQVRDVVHGVHHEIHRHDVQAPALDADRRHPLGQCVADFLDHLEEVIGPVDLVHLTGL